MKLQNITMEQKRSYRFFYHYRRSLNSMSVHFRNKCYPVKDIECKVPSETKWNKIQPYLTVQGFASEVIIENNKAIII